MVKTYGGSEVIRRNSMPSDVSGRRCGPTSLRRHGRIACRSCGVAAPRPSHRRRRRDPRGQPQQVRDTTTTPRHPPRPAAVLGHRVPGRLRLHPRHARRGRRPARRARAARRPDVPRLLDQRPAGRRVLDGATTRAPTPRSSASPPATPAGTTSPDIGELPDHLSTRSSTSSTSTRTLEPGKFASTRGYEGVDAAWPRSRRPPSEPRPGADRVTRQAAVPTWFDDRSVRG